MTRQIVAAALLAGAAIAAGCATGRPAPQVDPAGTPDAPLGLAPGSVFDAPAPPPVAHNDSAPGEQPALPRPYRTSPPRIPHSVDAFLPITRTENACLGCHSNADARPGEATPIPPSHFVDLRNAPQVRRNEVSGARRDCLLCHVPTTGAKPLVGNEFQP